MANWSFGRLPINCDLCHSKLQDGFIDGKTKRGPWGIMCKRCHGIYGVGLGTGKGQRYNQAGKKVEG